MIECPSHLDTQVCSAKGPIFVFGELVVGQTQKGGCLVWYLHLIAIDLLSSLGAKVSDHDVESVDSFVASGATAC